MNTMRVTAILLVAVASAAAAQEWNKRDASFADLLPRRQLEAAVEATARGKPGVSSDIAQFSDLLGLTQSRRQQSSRQVSFQYHILNF